jgi:hypothetical protein
MYPTIKDGESITVEPVVASQVKRGNILFHHNGRGVIAHRVVRIARKKPLLNPQDTVLDISFILRGDASSICDEPVEAGQVLGKVVSVERNGRLIDLDTWKSKVLYAAHLYGSRFKRSVIRNIRWMKIYCHDLKLVKRVY